MTSDAPRDSRVDVYQFFDFVQLLCVANRLLQHLWHHQRLREQRPWSADLLLLLSSAFVQASPSVQLSHVTFAVIGICPQCFEKSVSRMARSPFTALLIHPLEEVRLLLSVAR
ncbi:hypothetical protein IG631_23836 [Alternaria alternata]|nr:hypothetical protein IG631_23836 [Alternaria alternata]